MLNTTKISRTTAIYTGIKNNNLWSNRGQIKQCTKSLSTTFSIYKSVHLQ